LCPKIKVNLNHYSDGGRPNSASIFVGGFILGGLIVGALGCVYAPQVLFLNKACSIIKTATANANQDFTYYVLFYSFIDQPCFNWN